MAKLYSVDASIVATAYILADSDEEAQKIADGLADQALQFSDRQQGIGVDDEIIITGETYSNDMPEISLSLAMTMVGCGGRMVQFQEDLDEEDECGQCEGTGTTDAMGEEEECPVCDGSGSLSQ